MKVLIACEFSGIVRDAFIKQGHDAVSCDLLPPEKPGPHIQGDVLEILDNRAVFSGPGVGRYSTLFLQDSLRLFCL